MLGELLLEERLISQKQLDQALALQHDSAKKLGQILVEKYLISAKKLEEILEKQYWQQNGFWLI